MSSLFGGGNSTPPTPPPAPTISQATKDANAAQTQMLRAGAVGQQQTVLTQGLLAPSTQKGATLLGGG